MSHSVQTRPQGVVASALKAFKPGTLFCALALVILAASALFFAGSASLMWQRANPFNVSGLLFSSIAHFNNEHAWLNVVSGLLLILTFPFVPLKHWLALFVLASPVIAVSAWLFSSFDTYAGASGVLHGWFAAGCVAGLSVKRVRTLCMVCLAGLLVKLGLESSGLVAFSHLGSFSVAHVSHITGALVGLIYGVAVYYLKNLR